MAAVWKRAVAKRDLVEHYVYLAENAGIDVAERFLISADRSFNDLLKYPEMGVGLRMHSPSLALRKWRVTDFESYLIFYIPRQGGVSIVRVLHSAQDWWRILEM